MHNAFLYLLAEVLLVTSQDFGCNLESYSIFSKWIPRCKCTCIEKSFYFLC